MADSTWSGKVKAGIAVLVGAVAGWLAHPAPPAPMPTVEEVTAPAPAFASNCDGAARTWSQAKQVYGLTHKRMPGDCQIVLNWYYARAKADSPYQYAHLPPMSCYSAILASPECKGTPSPAPAPRCVATGGIGPNGPLWTGTCSVASNCDKIGTAAYAGVGCKTPVQ